MALISIEAQVRLCRNGHPVIGYNAVRIPHVSGRSYIACRQCRRDAVNRVRARQRGESSPLLAAPPAPKPEPQFATMELWKALPADLRFRVAAVLLDREPDDPLVAAVIKRAAKRRVWTRLGTTYAAIAMVEALVDEVRDARSDRLRIDRVLMALLT